MKNNEEKFEISEIKNMLFLSHTKWKIEFKCKNLFCKTIVHKWDIAIIHFHLLYTIPCTLTTSNITSLLVHHILKNSILQSSLSLIGRINLWIESVLGMNGAWWILSGSTILSNWDK